MSKTILFTVVGALTGLVISQVANLIDVKGIEVALLAFTLLVGSFSLTWEKLPTKVLVIFLSSLAVVLFSITSYYFYEGYHEVRRINLIFMLGMIQVTVICTAFFQSWKASKPHYSYADLFENAWNNHFYYLFSGLLTGAFLLILLLGTELFKSINMRFFGDFIWDENVAPIISLALIGTGVGISREYEQLIFRFRSVFFALFRVLAYLTACLVILFSLVLPFSIDALFAGRNTSLILLSLVAISIALLNALEDKESKKLPKWANRLFSVQIVLLPILSAVSLYAIYLRISQYGLMPNRIIALWAALIIGSHAFAYLIQMMLKKGQWSTGLARVNPPLAIVWVVSIVLLASPLLDPIKLSVNNQVSRLKNTVISADKFDFRALRSRLGAPGKAAIEDMKNWKEHPQYSLIIKQMNNPRSSDKRVLSITLIGEAPENLAELKNRHYKGSCNDSLPCFIKLVKMNETDEKQVMVYRFKIAGNKRLTLYSELFEFDQRWSILKRFNSKPFGEYEMPRIIESIKNEKVKLIKPRFLDMEVDGIQLRQ